MDIAFTSQNTSNQIKIRWKVEKYYCKCICVDIDVIEVINFTDYLYKQHGMIVIPLLRLKIEK